jgi:HlyD family secretion protein
MTKATRTVGIVVAALILIVLILTMAGVFDSGKIAPESAEQPAGMLAPAHVETALQESRPVWYEAVGTVSSRATATVAPQTTGNILSVNVDAGTPVNAGDVLATLDAKEHTARAEQARGTLNAAQASLTLASSNWNRIKTYFEQEAATAEQLEAAESERLQAEAAVVIAQQRLNEVSVTLDYTRILAPIDGIVGKRLVEPGDLAWPGKPLFLLHDPQKLRLDASVREGLIHTIHKGQELEVSFSSLQQALNGTVDEILPLADPTSRSFLVKVSLSVHEGLYPGMFGTLRIQLGTRDAITVPDAAVTRVGQVSTMMVRQNGRWLRRLVTTGDSFDGRTEMLSGVSNGETIGWEPGHSHAD